MVGRLGAEAGGESLHVRRLLEREQDLARLQTAMEHARGGDGRLVLIDGEAGIGKSALLAAAAGGAAAGGFRVLAARGAELEREFGSRASPLPRHEPRSPNGLMAPSAGLAVKRLAGTPSCWES
jgi:predicted ATP-dependent serine protease